MTVAAVPVMGNADRLSALPGDVLRQIVGLLPVQEAVQTSVLARPWRDVWKTTDRLLVTGESVEQVQEIVDHLLSFRLRRRTEARLSACVIDFLWFEEEDEPCVDGWIRRALQCEIETLQVYMWGNEDVMPWMRSSHKPLVSCHLKRLYLNGIVFCGSFLDLSSCPALEDLDIYYSEFSVRKMTSPSLKRLCIKSCHSFQDSRVRICAPRLVSLLLHDPPPRSMTPLLESMPELVVAHVEIGGYNECCSCVDRMGCDHVMDSSKRENEDDTEQVSDDEDNDDTRKCVLLSGLSEASHLTLISDDEKYIFRRDLRWCPRFSNLKTLILDKYWCYPVGCPALACILEHAPVLEKVTVLFSYKFEPEFKVEIKGRRLEPKDRSIAISEQLRIVEVKCEVVDERVLDLLKFMSTLNIWFLFKELKDSNEDGPSTT